LDNQQRQAAGDKHGPETRCVHCDAQDYSIKRIWAWYLLIQHSDVATKLYAEVDSSVGKQSVTFENLAYILFGAALLHEKHVRCDGGTSDSHSNGAEYAA